MFLPEVKEFEVKVLFKVMSCLEQDTLRDEVEFHLRQIEGMTYEIKVESIKEIEGIV